VDVDIMALTFTTEPIPFTADPDGVVRVGGTRVTLEMVATDLEKGVTILLHSHHF
jgi:hypothetical protein